MYYSNTSKMTPVLSENAIEVLRKRYLRSETPDEMFSRIASAVAKAEIPYIEKQYTSGIVADNTLDGITTRFYNLMASLDFLPNSPTLMNAGRELAQLAACFVVPIKDSMDGIFTAVHDMAMIQKTGGGTGFSFSGLRPRGDTVSSTTGEASGPVSFMKVFNAGTEAIKQGGARRGANMAILRVDHPDILEFVDCKRDLSELTNFNISVGITDEFMRCLLTGQPFQLKFNGVNYAKVDPRMIFEKIVLNAWTSGEPGVVFLDRINEDNPTPSLGDIESTNPCGEQPLLPYEGCNLGSINVAHMVKRQPVRDPDPNNNINWNKLDECITLAVQFLDDIIDINKYPLEVVEDMAKGNRKIGLGIMGWGDLLYQLDIPYDSQEAVDLARKLMEFIQVHAHIASNHLGCVRGVFPNWQDSIWGHQGIIMRNATTTTIAPTGTLAVIAGVSSSVEPLFAIYTEKHLTDGGILQMFNPYLVEHVHRLYEPVKAQEILDGIMKTGSAKHIRDLASTFKIANEIHPLDHVRMQAAFQEYTDNAVSKTINFDNSATQDDIAQAIIEAHRLGCKGITVYRDGSRMSQPLTKGKSKEPQWGDRTSDINMLPEVSIPRPLERPEVIGGETRKVKTGCGIMFVTINNNKDKIYEVFLKAGSTGGCAAFTEGTSRLISIALRYGVPIDEIINQLNSVRCDNFRYQTGRDPSLKGKSCPDVVGRLLKEKIAALVNPATPSQSLDISEIRAEDIKPLVREEDTDICPDCGAKLKHDGCTVCIHCGFSRC